MDLKWNPGAHDERVDAGKKIDNEKRLAKAKDLVGREYKLWKSNLLTSGKVNGMSQAQIVESLYNLHAKVGKMCEQDPALFEFRSFTMAMIEDKISQVIQTECGTKNMIVEWLPEIVRNAPDRVTAPQQAVFSTEAELYEVPFVKNHHALNECVGLLRDGLWVKALYTDGNFVPVGMCANTVGTIQLPTVSQMQKALSETGTSPEAGGPTPYGPQTTEPGTTLPTTAQGGNPSGSPASDTPRSSDPAA